MEIEYDGKPFIPNWASPPSDSMKRIVKKKNKGLFWFMFNMEIDFDEAEAILNGSQPITERIAKKLSHALGSTPEFWIRRQKQYEEDKERIENT